jgi:predicted RNA-binding protein with RPS1 domain
LENTENRSADPIPELLRLVDLVAKYPEIGPPLAELAFKIGQAEIASRLVRMGLEGGVLGLEYYVVAANAARRDGRIEDALAATVDAVRTFGAATDAALQPDDGVRLLHLVRTAFSIILFDRKDPNAEPGFIRSLAEALPALEPRLGADPLYRSLVAQTLWYEDRDKSEKEWDRAGEGEDSEHAWNARGTWYKEAEHDTDKAERAYRLGLEKAPQSALLMHNLAQLLLEKAARPDISVEETHRLLRQADDLLRNALRQESPKGLRRHVHTTRDRLATLRSSLPPLPPRGARHAGEEPAPRPKAPPPPEPGPDPVAGEAVRGRVVSLTAFGAFLSLPGTHVGLLHKSEMAHEFVTDPATLFKVGDEAEVKILDVRREGGKLRIALSRRALLPAPERPAAPPPRPRPERQDRQDRPPRQDRRPERQEPDRRDDRRAKKPEHDPEIQRLVDGKLASLGEMILAKLKAQKP